MDLDWMFGDLRSRHLKCLCYHLFFITRRFLIALSLVALPENYLFQVLMHSFSSAAFLVYLLDAMPYKEPSQNLMEIINETFILTSTYFTFVFSDLVPDNDTRYKLGWALCCLIGANVAFNFLVTFSLAIRTFYRKLRIWNATVKRT